MADNNPYDMKQKLLELQSELLKNASDKQYSAQVNPVQQQSSAAAAKSAPVTDDAVALLKELCSNQRAIIHLLEEINRKIR